MPEHLMLRSGEWVRCRGSKAASSEAEASWCVAWPSSEAEVCPRGTAADFLMGRYDFLCRGPFSALGCDHAVCFVVRGIVRSLFIIFSKGCFPPLLGDPYGRPRHTSLPLPLEHPKMKEHSHL
jgi:hypothetical protein